MRYSIYIVVLFMLAFHSTGCDTIGPVQKAIFKKSQSCDNSSQPCVFALSSITSFQWDKLYLFDEDTRPEKISSLLNIKYSQGIPEDKTRMIFTLNGKIVHQEDFDWGSNESKKINNIGLPIDTTSPVTKNGCYTKEIPFVSKEDAVYKLVYSGPETSPLFSKMSNKNQKAINLILLKSLGKCYEEQITVEDIN